MDWLLGRKSQSQNTSSQPPPQLASTQAPPVQSQNPQLFETPDIDTLLTPHDPASLHPLENLDKQTLDYIILEDEQIKTAGALPSRGWTDDLCYGTGTTYLTALGVGGMWGVIEALQKPRVQAQAHSALNPSTPLTETLNNTARAAQATTTSGPNPALNPATRQSGKLLLNNILNHVTRRGPFLGNSAGVLAMTYNLINGGLENWTPLEDGPATPLLSGFLAGALFRSTKGPKAMVITGMMVMGISAAWQGVKRTL